MPRILLIDDDAALRGVVRRALERAGHEVVDANDAASGLRLQEQAPADLVITDIYMPGEDGIQAIRRLRKSSPGLKILAMSGGMLAGPADLREHALVLGANAVLAKPFELATLVAEVARLLAGTEGERP
jgi:CheY-like chemotaxis protein